MSSFRAAIMTDAGAKLMADSIIEGCKIEFVKMVIGSGVYEEDEKTAEALRVRTELKQVEQEVGFSSRLVSDENEVLLKTLITNKELDVGYRMREIGIIAKRVGEDEEILYSIAVAEEADYLPPKDNPVEIIQEYCTKVSNVENIVINVEMEAYALAEDMQKVLYPEYDEAEELAELESGRSIFKEFGKLKKAVSDLIGHIRDKVIHITSEERKLWNTVSDKVDKVKGKGLSTNDYTTEEKNKLRGIEERANNYVHPNTHPANIIVQDSAHRFVTDSEKNTWNEILDNAKNYSDSAYQQATGYTDQKIADLIGGAPETLDTLKEVADAIEENADVVEALNEAIGKKANQTELDTHTGNNTIHITSQERTNWNDANTKKHTHSNKGVLDKITQALLDNWNAAYTHISDAVKHITAAERTLWNTVSNKVDKVSGKGLSANDYTTAEKNKLAGIAAGANNYTHPTTAGNKHIPSGGSSGQILRWSADGTATWGADNDTKVTQTNTTANADTRLLLSGNANSTTETNTAKKSDNFLANPAKGDFFAKGYRRIDITGATLDVNTLTLSEGYPNIARYIERTDGGSSKITNIPVAGHPFLLDVEMIRWNSTTDYITMQTFRNASDYTHEYVRICTNGTWTAWQKRIFTDTNTTYNNATQSLSGLMSNTDKKKMDGIAEGANKTVVDTALSDSSTNPVQNKIVKSALDGKLSAKRVYASGQNTADYPWHRIAYATASTGTFTDKDMLIMLKAGFSGGNFGILKVSTRSNGSGQEGGCTAEWIIRKGYSLDDIQVGFNKTSGNVYADLFLKASTYVRTDITLLSGAGGSGWEICNSSEGSNGGKGENVFTSVASAGTELRGGAYSVIKAATDAAVVAMVRDIGNSSPITFAYSWNELKYAEYSWLAGWNGYELRAVNKDQFAVAGHTHSYAGSPSAGGAANGVYLPRVAKSCTYKPGTNKVIFEEFTSGTNYGLPSTHWYHIITCEGSDAKFLTQIAVGMTVTAIYYRNCNNDTWSAWKRVILSGDTMTAATSNGAGTSGLVPAPATGADNLKFLRGDGTWQVPANTTYSAATQSAAGLMSAADKKKLDGIAEGANKTGSSLTVSELKGATAWSATEKYFTLNSIVRFRGSVFAPDDGYSDYCNLGAKDYEWKTIYGKSIYATTLYEGETKLSDKYAAKSHSHNYLSGDLAVRRVRRVTSGTTVTIILPFTSGGGLTAPLDCIDIFIVVAGYGTSRGHINAANGGLTITWDTNSSFISYMSITEQKSSSGSHYTYKLTRTAGFSQQHYIQIEYTHGITDVAVS